MRIGIACSGLDNVRRGFESFAEDLFQQLSMGTALDAMLFKGHGRSSQREHVLWTLSRESPIWGGRSSALSWERRYFTEQVTFGCSLWRDLRREPVDILLFSDIQVGNVLRRLSRVSQVPILLFSNGGPFRPVDYQQYKFIHQLTPGLYQEALERGIPSDRMFLVPYGVDTDRFSPDTSRRKAFRESLGIQDGEMTILSVGALGAPRKRMNWLIEETAAMKHKPHVVLCGEYESAETTVAKKLGWDLIGPRLHILSVSYAEMPAIYNCADVFVLCSLEEGLSRAFLESLASGVPVVHHTNADMNWIVGRGGLDIDMKTRGRLAAALTTITGDDTLRSETAQEARSRAVKVFSWKKLLPDYIEMFAKAHTQSARAASGKVTTTQS